MGNSFRSSQFLLNNSAPSRFRKSSGRTVGRWSRRSFALLSGQHTAFERPSRPNSKGFGRTFEARLGEELTGEPDNSDNSERNRERERERERERVTEKTTKKPTVKNKGDRLALGSANGVIADDN